MSTPLLPFYIFIGTVLGLLGASAILVRCIIAYRKLTKGKDNANSKK